MDIYVSEAGGSGIWIYQVWVDGEIYDQFTTSRSLTWSQQNDIAKGYREALDV